MGSVGEKIALDAMGGDHAPRAIVAGAVKACEELGVSVQLVGDREAIQRCLDTYGSHPNIEIIDAPDTIDMHEDPIKGLRRKPKASISVTMKQVRRGLADAAVSAGHSGAAMAAGLLRLGRIPGIDRPAIAAIFPTVKAEKPVLLLDVGANVDCRPKFLEQFAVMGSVYSNLVLGTPNPTVGLVNIGEEASKGNDLAVKTYPLLEANPNVNFTGNAEGRDILSGDFDVVVCDGFVGNVVLKFAEAVGSVVIQLLREELPRGKRGKVGTLVLKSNLKRLKKRIDHAEHGGGLLLGVNGVCVIGHGSSDAASVCSAIRIARDAVRTKVLEQLKEKCNSTAQESGSESNGQGEPAASQTVTQEPVTTES